MCGRSINGTIWMDGFLQSTVYIYILLLCNCGCEIWVMIWIVMLLISVCYFTAVSQATLCVQLSSFIILQSSFSYLAPAVCNGLFLDIRSSAPVDAFKPCLKSRCWHRTHTHVCIVIVISIIIIISSSSIYCVAVLYWLVPNGCLHETDKNVPVRLVGFCRHSASPLLRISATTVVMSCFKIRPTALCVTRVANY